MVGDEGGSGGSDAHLTDELQTAYEAAADSWAAGPGLMYAILAEALVGAASVPLADSLVLDLGAGTGVAGRAALAAGARQVVAADLAVGMLRRCDAPLQPVAADAVALPFRAASFDLVVAAFCLSHLVSVPAGLSEARRVGGAIAASMFAPSWTHPAKAAVDEVLRSFGYRPPAWYVSFKGDTEPQAGDPALLAERAAAAGFTDVRLQTIDVRTALTTPERLASWRLGLAHVAPFMRSLDPLSRADVQQEAERAVAGFEPLVVSTTVLTAG